MQHELTPHTKKIESYAWWDEGFSKEQLDWLQDKIKEASTVALAGTLTDGAELEKVRRSNVHWLNKEPETFWVYEKLAHIVSSLNAEHFHFDLKGFGEPLQLTNYHESKQGMYTWHQDFGAAGQSRKLSLVLQLSHPDEYEGGELQILTGKNPQSMLKKRGLITVFPAWTLHQVTPVIKGSRQTLVAWVTGTPFR